MYHLITSSYRSPRQRAFSGDSSSTVSSTSSTTLATERSQARAQQLQALYELSSDKNFSLNKNANFKIKPKAYVPSLNTASAKLAAAAFHKKEKDYREQHKNDGFDPLLEDHEKKDLARQKLIAERKALLKAQNIAKGESTSLALGQSNYGSIPRRGSNNLHHSAVTPSLRRYAESSFVPNIVRNNTTDDSERRDDNMEIRRTGSGGLVMVDWTRRQVTDPLPIEHGREEREHMLEVEESKAASKTGNANLATGRSKYGALQRRGSKNWHHSAMTPSLQKYAEPSNKCFDNHSGIVRNHTMDDYDMDMPSIMRSGSGGLIMHDKEACNQAKALEMLSRLESADDRDMSLNRQGVFKVQTTEYTFAAKLGESILAKEASEVFRKKEQNFLEKHKNDGPDPLLTKHEWEEKDAHERTAQRKVQVDAKHQAKMVCIDIRHAAVRGRYPFQANQQNVAQQGHKASNVKVYDLPMLC
jgi:hypothetical protein